MDYDDEHQEIIEWCQELESEKKTWHDIIICRAILSRQNQKDQQDSIIILVYFFIHYFSILNRLCRVLLVFFIINFIGVKYYV